MRDPRIDWSRYPKLAKVYELRPDDHPYCRDLRTLVDSAEEIGVATMLATLERTAFPSRRDGP